MIYRYIDVGASNAGKIKDIPVVEVSRHSSVALELEVKIEGVPTCVTCRDSEGFMYQSGPTRPSRERLCLPTYACDHINHQG